MTSKPYFDQRISRKETQVHGLTALRIEQRFYPLAEPYASDPTLNHIHEGELLYELDEGDDHLHSDVAQVQSVISGRNITHYTQVKKIYGNATFDGKTFHPARYKRQREDGYLGDAQLPQLSVANIARFRVGLNAASNTIFRVGQPVWWCIPEDSIERRTLFLSNEFVPSHQCEAHKGTLDHCLHEYFYRFYGWVASTDAYSFEVALIHTAGIQGRFMLPPFKQREVGDWIKNYFTSTCLISDEFAQAVNPFVDTWFAGNGPRDFQRNDEFEYRFYNATRNINSVLLAWYERINRGEVYDDQGRGQHKLIEIDEPSNTVILNITLTSAGEHEYNPTINLHALDAVQEAIRTEERIINHDLQDLGLNLAPSRGQANVRLRPDDLSPDGLSANDLIERFRGEDSISRHFVRGGFVDTFRELDEEWSHFLGKGSQGRNEPIYDTIWRGIHQLNLALGTFRMQIDVDFPANERTPEMNAQVNQLDELIQFVRQCGELLNTEVTGRVREVVQAWVLPDNTPGALIQAYNTMCRDYQELYANPGQAIRYRTLMLSMRTWLQVRTRFIDYSIIIKNILNDLLGRDLQRINEMLDPILLHFREVFRAHAAVAAPVGNLPLNRLNIDLRDVFVNAEPDENWVHVAREAHDRGGLDVLRIVSTICQYAAVTYIGMDLCVNLVFVALGNGNQVAGIEQMLTQTRLNMIRKSCSHVDVSDVDVSEENGLCVLRLTFQNSQSQNRVLF